jgi:hypothetical protein
MTTDGMTTAGAIPNGESDALDAELLIQAFNFLKSRRDAGRTPQAVLQQEGIAAAPETGLKQAAYRLARLWRRRRDSRPSPEEAARLIAEFIARHGVTRCPPAILGRLGIELDLGLTAPVKRSAENQQRRAARAKRAVLKAKLSGKSGRPRK